MKHCKRIFSFLLALALLLSLGLPSFSLAEPGPAEDAARSAPEASVENGAEDAEPWEDGEPAGDGAEAPAPECPTFSEEAEDAAAGSAPELPASPEEAGAAEDADDAPPATGDRAGEADAAEEADAEAPAEDAGLSEEAEVAGAEAAPPEADFSELPEAREPDAPAGAEAPAPEDAALSEEAWDEEGEAPPPEFPDLWEEPETDAALLAEGALLRLTADTRWNSPDNIHVVVEADAGVLPPDTALRAAAVKDPDILRLAREAVESADRRVALVQALELGFFGPDGAALEPEGPVRVTLYSYRAARFRELELVSVLDDWTDVVETTQNLASLGFELYESGVYAIVGTEAVVFEHLSAQGGAASVTVSYDPVRFGFLRDASLSVRELEDEALAACLEAAAQALGTESTQLLEAHFFDIQLCAPDGTAYHELGGDVRVTVRPSAPLEPEDGTVPYAVHFADGLDAPPEISDAALSEDGTEFVFTQSGFSVTGVVLSMEYNMGVAVWPPQMSSYVILVREPLDPEDPEKDRPFYMLEVMLGVEDDPYPYIETRENHTFYQYRVKLVEAPGVEVDEASGKPTTLHIDDDPDNGKIYDDIGKIAPWLWTLQATKYEPFFPDNQSGKNSYNGLMNVATECYLGPAKVNTRINDPETTDYCAAKVDHLLATDDAVDVLKAFDLSFCTHEAYPNRLASRNMFCGSSYQYYWYFLKTEGTAQDGQSYFYLKGERLSSADKKTLREAPPEGALEFFFVSDILINGQAPLAQPHQLDDNPYYFHRYSDNPENPAAETEPTADPPAASKTLTARDDGTYDLSLSVTANTREGSFSEGSAEVVLVVDATHSMTQNYAHEKEAAALLEIGGMLMQKNVPIHVVLFSSGAWTDFQTYTSENAEKYEELITVKLRNWIESNESNTSSLGGNTNWEAGMKLGAEVLRQIEAAEDANQDDDVLYKDKYLIFISDGEPNQKLTDEAEYLRPIATLSAFDGGLGYHASDSTGDISRSFTKFTHAREVARQITDGGASVLVVNINFGMEEQSAVMKALAYYAASGGIYGTPPTGTYYEAEATSDDEDKIAGELIAAARFVLRKFLYQDVSLSDGLTDGTALAGATELAPEGAVPDFSYTITLKDGTAYDGELPAGETALRFFRDTEGVRVYLCADGTESADAAKALRLRGADYDSTTRKVNWSIQSAAPGNAAHYMLIEDATYTVSFPVWPTQETYDAISGRENNQADITLPQGLFPLEEYDYSFLRSHPPTSLSSLFELLELSPADVQQVVSSDPEGIAVTEPPENWTMTVAQDLDHPVVLTITTNATAEQDSRVIVVRATGVAGQSHAASVLQACTYTFPLNASPDSLSGPVSWLNIAPDDVMKAVSSDPEGMVLKRKGTDWKLNVSEGCDHALLTLTMRDGSIIMVYAAGSEETQEEAIANGLPAATAVYDYPFPYKQTRTSLSRLFELLGLSPETVARVVSSDPENLAVTHAAQGKWNLHIAEDLTHAAVLTITQKDGTIIPVYVTDTEDDLTTGTFHFEEYEYTFPSDHPPTSLSGLFALLDILPADVVRVMSGDPARISVTADENTLGKWNVVVAKNLDQPTLLTLIMQDGSVFAIHASPVEASQRIAPQEYTYTFPRTPALTSPSNLFELLQISQEDVYMLVSDDPDGILVSKAATGDWTLHVAENLDRPVLLTITKQNGELIAVHATPSDAVPEGSIAEPDSPWVLREYRSPFDAAPTLLSELFALTGITGANAVKVVSSDPAGISVTGEQGNWSLQVMPGLDHGVLLTITMDDDSVIPVYVTDSEESATRITSRSWGLSTNTKGTAVNFTPRLLTQEGGDPPAWHDFPSNREDIENPAPVELAAWTVYARKLWLDSGTEHSAIQSLTLHLHQVSGEHDNPNYIGAVTLTGRDGWLSADFSISPGMMVEKTAETASWGKAVTFDGAPYVLLNEGYGYYFTEELPDSAGDLFQLEEDVFYPMLVDGVPVNATRVGDAYTDVGRLVKPLQVKNRLNGIEITKQVVDSAGKAVSPQDTVTTDEETEQAKPVLFPVKVTLMAPEGGDLSDFPLLDEDDPDSPRVARYGVYDWAWNSLTPENNYLVFDGRGVAEGVIDLPNGGTIFFPGVPEGTRYAVEEPEASMPEGYSFQDAAYLIRDPNTHQYRNADSVTVEADGKTVTRYLAIDGENRVTVINRLIGEIEKEPILPRIVVDKFQTGDNSQKLSGASFALYRYPTQAELDEDPALTEETPMYYTRLPDSGQPPEADSGQVPAFQPDREQALTVTTDADGFAEFPDLPDGVYYLLETEAPVDYHRLIAPIKVTVDTSWLEEAENPTEAQVLAASMFVVPIANSPKTTLPATGGPGAAWQAGLGPLGLWFGAAGIVILWRKRKTARR